MLYKSRVLACGFLQDGKEVVDTKGREAILAIQVGILYEATTCQADVVALFMYHQP